MPRAKKSSKGGRRKHKKGKRGRHGQNGQKRIQAAPVQEFSDPSGSDDEEEQRKWPRDLELDDDEFVLKYRYLLSADDVKICRRNFESLICRWSTSGMPQKKSQTREHR